MDYLQAKLGLGKLDRVKISKNLTICHRLFVDDVGIFILAIEQRFDKLQKILKLYKTTYGAKLNVSKSIIIPLALPTTPSWLANTSCTINAPGEFQKYFGAQLTRT